MATNTATRRDDKATGVWQAPGHPVAVEYSTQVLEELRATAEDGFQKIPHGGIEVGALLLGTRDTGVVRVLEWRPIECEHAKGPGFVLSDKDLAGLESLIENCRQAPELRSLRPVGWFHTHTRSKIFLSADDLAIHKRFFPEPDAVALVMRLTKDHPATAGFFLQDSTGAIQPETSPLEFTVTPDPAALLGPIRLTAARRGAPNRKDRPARPAADASSSSTVRPEPAAREASHPPAADPEPPLEPAFTSFETPRKPAFAVKAGKAALVFAGIAGLAAIAWNAAGLMPSKAATADLKLEEIEGQLEVHWDHAARAVRSADRGAITIQDGNERRGIDLTAEDVRRGTVFYTRTSDDLQVRLELFRGDEVILQEMARFLGQSAPKRPGKTPAPVAQAEPGRAEVEQLREKVADEVKRGEGLRKEVRELEDQMKRESAKR